MATSKKSSGGRGGAKRSSGGRSSSKSAGRSGGRGGAAKKGGARGAAKKGGARGAAKKGGGGRSAGGRGRSGGAKKAATKRAPNPAFMRPMQPDEQLAAVVGNNPMPRTEITKKLWDYIKRNGLQDAQERRMINADDRLRPLFGGKRQVSMFDMTKMVNQHLQPA